MDTPDLSHALESTLQTTFGLKQFRPGQKEALICLLKEKHLLCIQPTGHGKSLLYQLPSVLLPGTTLVISPLLALMRDQIEQLNNRFGITAVSVNSDQTAAENFQAKKAAHSGNVKIIFVAPEKLTNLDEIEFLLQLPISLVVIDEAHCISTWGHDFRPSYRQIIELVKQLEANNANLHVLAITATANAKTEADIIKQLSHTKKNISVHRHSMNRANLALTNFTANNLAEKLLLTKQFIQQLEGQGLVYCATRENTELVANFLKHHNFEVAAYHAGLDPEHKQQLQQAFMLNKFQVISATNALGMGIDKSDLRYIIHFDIPGSITAYYQEVGRAGRDGLPSQGILIFNKKDKKIHEYFIASAQPTRTDFDSILNAVKALSEPTLLDIKRHTGFHPTRVSIVIAELMEQNFIEKVRINQRQVYVLKNNDHQVDLSRYEEQLYAREWELTEILKYAAGSKCLMATLRMTLGDKSAEKCGKCSSCLKTNSTIPIPEHEITATELWLSARTVSIDLGKNSSESGFAVLNATLRSPLVVEFMRYRQQTDRALNPKMLELIHTHIKSIQKNLSFAGIIIMPSRTWKQRLTITQYLTQILKIPVFTELLLWKQFPDKRQGECLNNDQRKYNIQHKMTAARIPMPSGPLLLFDDYIGCGATMNEAIRALKADAGIKNKIVPMTIASVKWKLGQPGMV